MMWQPQVGDRVRLDRAPEWQTPCCGRTPVTSSMGRTFLGQLGTIIGPYTEASYCPPEFGGCGARFPAPPETLALRLDTGDAVLVFPPQLSPAGWEGP